MIRLYYGFINILSLNGNNISIIYISICNAIKCLDMEKVFTVYS